MTWQTKMATETPSLVHFLRGRVDHQFHARQPTRGRERYGARLKPMAMGSKLFSRSNSDWTTIDVTRRSARRRTGAVMVSIDSNLALEDFDTPKDTWYKDMREPGFLLRPRSTPVCSGLLPKL